jgi:chlorophyll(ide) b reductase
MRSRQGPPAPEYFGGRNLTRRLDFKMPFSPGMVFTKLLLDDSTPELRKFPFGVLAAQPEEVAADLVPKILAAKQNGSLVEFLTTERVLTKFFERFILFKKSEYIDDQGNVIKVPGEQYDDLGVRSLY